MGESLTYIPAETAIKLNKIGGQYLGISPGLNGGLYRVYRPDNQTHTLVVEPIAKGGGSHEEMWSKFIKSLNDLENRITLSQGALPPAMTAVSTLETLRGMLSQQGKNNGAWLSSVRNAVNYKHDYGVWYPYKIKQQISESIISRMEKWQEPINSIFSKSNNDLLQLVDSCNLLIRIAIAGLLDISYRSPNRNKSFVDRTPLQLLKQRRVNL